MGSLQCPLPGRLPDRHRLLQDLCLGAGCGTGGSVELPRIDQALWPELGEFDSRYQWALGYISTDVEQMLSLDGVESYLANGNRPSG